MLGSSILFSVIACVDHQGPEKEKPNGAIRLESYAILREEDFLTQLLQHSLRLATFKKKSSQKRLPCRSFCSKSSALPQHPVNVDPPPRKATTSSFFHLSLHHLEVEHLIPLG